MNCKNCGTPIQPGALRCPTCNIEYAKSDALEIPEVPTDALSAPLLPDDEITLKAPVVEDKQEYVDPNIIKPIDMPIATEINIPIINEIHEDLDETNLTVEERKKIFPEERGGNKFFIFLGVLIVLVGGGFLIYASFFNKKIIDEIVYYFNPSARPEEKPPVNDTQPEEEFETIKINLEDLEKYNTSEIKREDILKMFKDISSSLDNVTYMNEELKIVVLKEVNKPDEAMKDGYKELEKGLNNFAEDATFIISIEQIEEKIEIVISEKLEEEVVTNGE